MMKAHLPTDWSLLEEAERQAVVAKLDAGIRSVVHFLLEFGIETFESCEGGPGHAYKEPTIRFHGNTGEGWRAFGLVKQRDLPVRALHRVWSIDDGEPVGPYWELVFWRKIEEEL